MKMTTSLKERKRLGQSTEKRKAEKEERNEPIDADFLGSPLILGSKTSFRASLFSSRAL